MGAIRTAGRTAWRKYVTDGLASSGNQTPEKDEIFAFVDEVDSLYEDLFAAQGAGLIVKSTKAQLDADLAHAADTGAWVTADSTAANNGVYRKSGASGSGSWSKVMEFPGTVSSFVAGGTANARTATGTPTLTAYRAGVVFVINFGNTTNDDVCTLNIDSVGAKYILEQGLTTVDPGRVGGTMALTYDATYDAFIILSPTRPETSRRRLARAGSYTALSNVTSPGSRYSEGTLTQNGSVITSVGAIGLLIGRGYAGRRMLTGDIAIFEAVLGGSAGTVDGVCLMFNPTDFSADNQILDATATGIRVRRDGATSMILGDLTAGESLSGQISTQAGIFANGDKIRIVVRANDNSTGGQILLFKNDDCFADLTLTTTAINARYIWAGMFTNQNAATITTNFVRHIRNNPLSRKVVIVENAEGSEGIGTRNSPFKTLGRALACEEYSADDLTFLLASGTYRGAIGYLPAQTALRIWGVGTIQAKLRGSTAHSSGGTLSKTAGKTNIWEKSATFAGTSGTGVAVANTIQWVGVAGNNQPVVGRAAAGRTVGHYIYVDAGLDYNLTTMDGEPGKFTVNTTDGKVYLNPIATGGGSAGASLAGMDFEECVHSHVIRIPVNKGGLSYMNMLLELRNLDIGFTGSSCVKAERVHIEAHNCLFQGAAQGYGMGADESSGNYYGCRFYGNFADGLNTVGSTTLTLEGNNRDFKDVHLWDCEACGNGGVGNIGNGDGVSAHWGIRLYVHGGVYSYNAKTGIISYQNDAHGALIEDNGDAGFYLLGRQSYDISATLNGCTINGSGVSGIVVSKDTGQTAGTARLTVGGGTKVAGSVTQHVLLVGISGTPTAISIDGYLLTSGSAPSSGDINNTDATETFVSPTYIT